MKRLDAKRLGRTLEATPPRFRRCGLVKPILGLWLLASLTLQAQFHFWQFTELYTNGDGTVQFVELFNGSPGQQFVAGQNIISRSADGRAIRAFTLPAHLPADSANRFMLLATPAFSNVPGGIRPDYVIPASFLFPAGGTIEFPGVDLFRYGPLPTNGMHSLDRFGVVDANSPVNFAGEAGFVTPGNARPTVQITNPANGAVFSSSSLIVIEAFASDSDGTIAQVEFFDGPNSLGADPSPPFRITFPLAPGGHILTARATDNLGATATSQAVTISVLGGQTRPSVQITRPADGAAFPFPASITIEATATDPGATISQIEFYDNSAFLGSDISPPFSLTTTLPAGVHQLTARAINSRGISTISAAVRITVTAVNSLPAVRITRPVDGTVYSSVTNILVEATATDTDGTIRQVEFFNNGTSLGVDTAAPFSVLAGLTLGEHTLTARATDNLGGVTTSTPVRVSVNPTGTRPIVRITSPAEGATLAAPARVTIEAAASDPAGIGRVEFFAGNQMLGVDAASPYAFTATLPAGNYALTVRAVNTRGISTTSQPINIVVAVPIALIITNIEVVGSNVRLAWAGGSGPFTVQRKLRLTDAVWSNVTTTSERTVSIPRAGATSFFRVVGQ